MEIYEEPLFGVLIWIVVIILLVMFWPQKAPVASTEIQFVKVKPEPSVVIFEDISADRPIKRVAEPPRYGFTEDDIYLMTVLLCGSEKVDGDGEYDIDFGKRENKNQISLVLSVVMNRVKSTKFPNTVKEVIWAANQFSPMPRWNDGLPKVKPESYDIVKDWCIKYDAYDPEVQSIPESHLFFTGNGKINKSRERW